MLPEMSVTTQAILRCAYGVVLLGAVLWNLLQGRRFFLSERWGGYGKQGIAVNAIQNPVAFPLVMAAWILSAIGIIFGLWGILPALINVCLCRYFFISMRWSGVLRGMGAPGFMTYWLGVAVLVLEFTSAYAPELRSLALLALQVDWAVIMIIAGIYKFTAGYPRNEGMELGLANPEWGTWGRFYARMRPSHPLFWFLNQMAWITEIGAGILMLIPDTRWIGGMVISFSFLFVGSQIRLNQLTPLLVLTGILFLGPESPPAQYLTMWFGDRIAPTAAPGSLPSLLIQSLAVGLVGYLVVLPFAYGGLCYNFFGRRRLNDGLQVVLELYTNFFGMILWRVFSVNLIDFFIRIHVQARAGGKRTLVSRYGWGGPPRFNHVGESITITTIFTTLKYYPNNLALFKERLVRYAQTISCPADSVLIFEYVSIRKTPKRFAFVSVAEYTVDLEANDVSERLLSADAPVRTASPVSAVHEAVRPGSYAPAEVNGRQEKRDAA
jgi:hypothetical protein